MRIVPYLSVAVTNKCNFRCSYCSPDGFSGVGEAYGTVSATPDTTDLEQKIVAASRLGVSKVRLTGGEPTLLRSTKEVMSFLEHDTNIEYSLATNGSFSSDWAEFFMSLPRLDLRISLDTLDSKKFQLISGLDKFGPVYSNVCELAQKKKLNRVAAVVTRENIEDVPSLIDFCLSLKLNLKLFDMYATPLTKKGWDGKYVALDDVKKAVEKKSVSVRQISYTRSFGIPSLEYKLNDDVYVRIKDSLSGTRYCKELCSVCDSYPCQEGLYTILYSPDRKLIPCRLSPKKYDASTLDLFKENIEMLINLFKDSYHENAFWRQKHV